MRLQGKTALVTGATAGIGQAIAEAFAREGARVVISGRDSQRGQAVVDGIHTTGGQATFLAADQASVEEVRRLAAEATDVLGHIDILVNNAGIGFWGSTEQTDEANFDALIAINVKGPFYLTAALAPQMVQRGSGKIINITSVVAHLGRPGLALYSATKGALASLTRSWAAEFGPHGVNVNAIAPGPTHTPGTSEVDFDQLTRRLPAGRAALPAEMAEAAVYLASDEANFVHGVTLPVDGGGTAV